MSFAVPLPARLAAVVLLLALIAMLGIAVVTAPSRHLAALLPDALASATFDWRGSVWRGSVALAPPLDWLPARDAGHLAWRVTGIEPISRRAILDASLRGPLHTLRGRAELSRTAQSVTGVHGELDLGLLAPLLARYDIILGGILEVDDLALRHDRHGLAVTRGRLRWGGGPVQFRLTGDWQTRRLPALDARVTAANRLQVSDAAGAPLLDVALGEDGWVKIGVRRHLLDLVEMPWADGDAPGQVVVVLEERLF